MQISVVTMWLCMLVETHIVASGLKSLIPVGTTISTAADVKYTRVSPSVPTVNTTSTHTTNTSNFTASMAKIIVRFQNASFSLFHRR
jgi:hypothetical protein